MKRLESLDVADTVAFRSVLSRFCTGVVVISSTDEDGHPIGMTCQSFSSLSLEPPLVLFCPAHTSATWPKIRESGRFSVSILGAEQEEVCRQFARTGIDKFDGVDWSPSPEGTPMIHGASAYLDCVIRAVHGGGDHDIVVGEVVGLHLGESPASPLLFHLGRFSAIAA